LKLTTLILAILLSVGCFNTDEKKHIKTETHIVYSKEHYEGRYNISFTSRKIIECDYSVYVQIEPNDTVVLTYVHDGLFVDRFLEIKKMQR